MSPPEMGPVPPGYRQKPGERNACSPSATLVVMVERTQSQRSSGKRVVLLLPTATYRATDFLDAARELGVEVAVGSEEPQTLAEVMGDRALLVPFDDPEKAADAIVDAARVLPFDAVVAVDEPGVIPAAVAAARLGLPHNPPDAVTATRDKAIMRRRLAAAGVPQPRFAVVQGPERPSGRGAGPGADLQDALDVVGLPCVVKPLSLSGSTGVIRADTPETARIAAERVRAIAGDPDAAVLVEEYVPGAEVAVEALLTAGSLDVLAIFDKPDPMEGPYFAETLLITPSLLPQDAQDEVCRVVADAAAALGLVEGPVHAEARIAPGGPEPRVRVLELAARSIGGLCSRALRFGLSNDGAASLEELILRQALHLPVSDLRLREGSAGVAMLYAPAAGTLEAIHGVDEAGAVDGIVEIDVTARPGAEVAPLPDSARYLGFVFARGDDPADVEVALREAVARIGIVVTK